MAVSMSPPAHAHDFLAGCGWQGAEILPLAGDASFRRYFRVVRGDDTAVLMDAPPPHEDPRPFVAVAVAALTEITPGKPSASAGYPASLTSHRRYCLVVAGAVAPKMPPSSPTLRRR